MSKYCIVAKIITDGRENMTSLVGFLIVLYLVTCYSDAACPDGWVRHGAHCYHYSHDLENWTGAKVMCESRGGYLVEIGSAEENHYITQHIQPLNRNYWIGLSDVWEEDVWVWMHSNTHTTVTFWDSGEPSNDAGVGNCVEIRANGHWNDLRCSYSDLYYICEKDDEVEVVGKR